VLHRLRLRRSRWQKSAYLAFWGRQVRRNCACWHYTSADEADASWPWDRSPRFVLGLGLDAERFAIDRDEARLAVAHRLPEIGDSPYVLFLGRLHALKRVDMLLAAFVRGGADRFKLVLAGPDEGGLDTPLARAALADPAAARRVVTPGLVTGADKVALLAAARAFALPSEHENFGLAVLEALGAGTPVLASPTVDAARLAAAEGLAELVPPDIDRWRASLAALQSRENVSPADASLARRWVEQHHSWSPIVRRLTGYYEQVRAGRSPGPEPHPSHDAMSHGLRCHERERSCGPSPS
jgi:glycosyltransferase involved in cell wall biosynthesis